MEIKYDVGQIIYMIKKNKCENYREKCNICEGKGKIETIKHGFIHCNECFGRGYIDKGRTVQGYSPEEHKIAEIRINGGGIKYLFQDSDYYFEKNMQAFLTIEEAQAECDKANKNEKACEYRNI